MMGEKSFSVHSVSLKVHSPLTDFLGFIESNYQPFLSDIPVQNPRVEVEYSQQAGNQIRKEAKALEPVSRDVRVSENSLYWSNEFGFEILVQTDGRNFKVRGFHFDLNKELSLESRLKNFQRSMRWCCHFPIFWLLKQERGMQVVHAAAVSKDGKGLAFCGLNGMGKSTLAMSLVKNHGYKLVTDNFLLLNHEGFFGFPERVRLDSHSSQSLDLEDEARQGDYVYAKHQLPLEQSETELVCRAAGFYVLKHGSEMALQPLSSEKGWEILDGFHDYLQEFPEYSFYAMLPLLSLQNAGPRCPFLAPKAPFALLTNPMNWNIKGMSERVLQDASQDL